MEIFKPVPSYEGLYEVSNYGRIRTIKRQGTDSRIRSTTLDRTGYLRVALLKHGISKSYAVHRLVCMAFLDNPESKRTVNHIDGNKQNNILSNLEWMTHSENHKHSYDNLGRKTHMEGKYGVLHHNAKKVYATNKLTGVCICFTSLTEAATATGCNIPHISSCCTGARKSHGGYFWTFNKPSNFVGPESKLQVILAKPSSI